MHAVFKSNTTLPSHLVRPKDAVDPAKQDGVVYNIHCACGEGLHQRNQQTYVGENQGTRQGHLGFRPKECHSHVSRALWNMGGS